MRVVALTILAAFFLGALFQSDAVEYDWPFGRVLSACDTGDQASCDFLYGVMDDEFGDAYDLAECNDQFYADAGDGNFTPRVRSNLMGWLRAHPEAHTLDVGDATNAALRGFYQCR